MDLVGAVDKIKSEGIAADQLIAENPQLRKYRRTLLSIEDDINDEMKRDFMTKGIWYYGSTERAKLLADNYQGTKYYHHDGQWWDNYRREDIVIINDFRGKESFSELMCMVDKWPHSVSRRRRSPAAFMSRVVIIISKYPPDRIYENDIRVMDKLYRRFEVIMC